jgi:hypothetical protein
MRLKAQRKPTGIIMNTRLLKSRLSATFQDAIIPMLSIAIATGTMEFGSERID